MIIILLHCKFPFKKYSDDLSTMKEIFFTYSTTNLTSKQPRTQGGGGGGFGVLYIIQIFNLGIELRIENLRNAVDCFYL